MAGSGVTEGRESSSWKTLGAAAGTGALVVVASPGVLPWKAAGLIAWVSFVPLLLVLPRLDLRRAALHGWVAGLVFQAGAASWYPGLMARYSGMSPAVAIALGILIWSLQALPWALWGAVARVLSRSRAMVAMLATAAAFAAVERFVPVVFRGPIALTQAAFPAVAQVAEPAGIHAVSWLIIVASFALTEALDRDRRRWVAVGAGALIVAAVPCLGAWRVHAVRAQRSRAESIRVAVLQEARIPQGWGKPLADEGVASRYQEATAQLEAQEGALDLVVWPEKAWPELVRSDARHDYPDGHARRIRRGFSSRLLFGITSVEVTSRAVANSAAVLEPDGKLTVFYDKVKLIPYSESGYRRGDRTAPYDVGGVGLGTLICFESTFAGHVAELANKAGVLVNLTDDTWFGASAEPEQHFAHAVYRAIETRRDLVRASAAGPSACIGATGEVVAKTGMGQGRLVCEARVMRRQGKRWEWGFELVCLAGAIAGLVIQCRRRSKPETASRRFPS